MFKSKIFFLFVLITGFQAWVRAGDPGKKIQKASVVIAPGDSTVKTSALDKDESIKCLRDELVGIEFYAMGGSKYGELLRITYQDLERGGREIIFQKKLKEAEEVRFFIPFETVKEAKIAVLIICKGSGMFFKKIEVKD